MTDNKAQDSGLDASLGRGITINWEVVAWIVIIALALLTLGAAMVGGVFGVGGDRQAGGTQP